MQLNVGDIVTVGSDKKKYIAKSKIDYNGIVSISLEEYGDAENKKQLSEFIKKIKNIKEEITFQKNLIDKNSRGFCAPIYDISTDQYNWHFGSWKFDQNENLKEMLREYTKTVLEKDEDYYYLSEIPIEDFISIYHESIRKDIKP